jgi:hypothetical protein
MARRIILAVVDGPVTPRHRYAAELCFETICGFELVDVVTAQEGVGWVGEVVCALTRSICRQSKP